MVEPVIWHPAADRATTEALIAEQDRSVVPMSTWLADAAVTAVTSKRVLQVLTPHYSRITYPLELLLREADAEWVVREGPERFRDGLHGFKLAWNGARFVPDLDAAIPPAGEDPRPGSGDLEVQISCAHPASETLELGVPAEAAVRALTGSEPLGWSFAEPTAQPWVRREITAYCRERAPSPTRLVVVGDGVVGQLSAERVDTGVVERVRISGPPAGAVNQNAIEALAAEMARTARLMVVSAHPGRLGGLRSSAPTLPALPYGVLIGHQVLAKEGADHARQAPVAQPTILGTGKRQACWYRLDHGPGRPLELLTAVLQHFGMPRTQAGE